MVIIKGPFVSSPEWPGTVPDLEPFHTLYWAGNVRGRSRPGMPNRTGPKHAPSVWYLDSWAMLGLVGYWATRINRLSWAFAILLSKKNWLSNKD